MDSPKPFDDGFTGLLIKLAFTFADKVSVRDEFSKRVLSLSGMSREVELEEDPAFKLKPERSLHILSKHGVNVDCKPLVGVNLRTLHPKIRRELINVMSKFLDWLITSSAEVVFIPFGYGSTPERFFDNDFIIANELKERIENANRFKIIDSKRKPEEILGIFSFFDLFIGMRFHSLIFSAMMEVPTVAIIYDTKTLELLKQRRARERIW